MRIGKRRARPGSNTDDDKSSGDDNSPSLKKVRWVQSEQTTEVATESTDSDEEDAVLDKTCLAAWCKLGRLGCAYYDPVKCVLYVLEDTQESPHFDLTTMLLEQSNPDIVLTSSKADDDFMDTMRDHMDVTNGVFQIRPDKDFIPSKGRDRLLSLRLLLELPEGDLDIDCISSGVGPKPGNAYDFMRSRRDASGDPTTQRWNALVRLSNFASVDSSPLCMASIGALLDHITRERAVGDLDGDGIRGLDVRDIEIISLDQVLQINSDALFSLQIFENESHASVHSDKTKEGLSLFGTLNVTKTSLGRSLLRTWLLRPSLSLAVINQRHNAVECFLRSENVLPASVMHGHLKGIKNVPRILRIMRAGKAKVSDWQGLVKFTFHLAMLRDTVNELHQAGDVEIVGKLFAALDVASFKDIGRKINETIDWEESVHTARVCVRPHIDEELDNRKHVYHGIDSILSKVAEQICEKVPAEYASSLNVVYFPQLGFLICVPMLEEWQTESGIQVIDGWSFQFSSNAHVYFKSQEMHDMDIHIGDLHSSIVDREIEIIEALLDEILVYDAVIERACDICAELDCLLSFAEASRMYGYRRPQMVEDNVIDIHRGRHPLHEQIIDTFVPNDARLAGGAGVGGAFQGPNDDTHGEWNSVLLCTGANACGKSVYLKQIAIIQYMAQIGCFVPAESATLGIVDKIFTRISTRESVSKVQSAFMIDLNQVSLALRNCTAHSLVLLDEFGKGTLSTDGAGLFCAVLKHLLARGANCPKVLAATHFHDVFRAGLLDQDRAPISFRHMQVMFTASDGSLLQERGPDSVNTDTDVMMDADITEDLGGVRRVGAGEKITYLYRVAEGLSLDSHAAKCAEIFGVPSRLVRRAQYVSHLLSTHELCRLLDEKMTEKERLDLEDAEAVCRRFLAWDLDAEEQEADAKTMLAKSLGRVAGEDTDGG
ncbi:putative ATPase domain of DNA mismatch repair MUTS family protein [Lyophyllum shimeji]|uniref:ATPase domain of DNA mismatch repair MUTS family protein n=1 Tax=Lyophyllum shimeji TaxID=47721 RepID=A0A9P3PMX6_LYOSH|nr:putative ATPase domain of DNA mismatch repair MUTS family protein [Lyophyllum shimeji]